MVDLQFVQGDATRPRGTGPRVIVHVCNDIGGWGKGFVVALSRRWKEPEADYRSWHAQGADEPFELGEVRFVAVEDQVWVANMIAQHGIHPKEGRPPIRYSAMASGLSKVCDFARERKASVHMPRIGCGLAGGSWDEVERIVRETLVDRGVSVVVYDFAP